MIYKLQINLQLNIQSSNNYYCALMGINHSTNRYSFTDHYYIIEDTFPSDNYYRLQSKITDQLFIGRQINSLNKEDTYEIQCIIHQKLKDPSPFVTKLLNAEKNKEISGCSIHSKFYLLYRQVSKLLAHQMQDRRLRQIPFSSEQILMVIVRVAKGLKYLYQSGHSHGSVSPHSVSWPRFPNQSVELIDDWALISQNRAIKSLENNQQDRKDIMQSDDLYNLGLLAQQMLQNVPNNRQLSQAEIQQNNNLKHKIFILRSQNPIDRMQLYGVLGAKQRQYEQIQIKIQNPPLLANNAFYHQQHRIVERQPSLSTIPTRQVGYMQQPVIQKPVQQQLITTGYIGHPVQQKPQVMGKPVNAISNSNANFKLPPKHNILINHENHLRASKAYNNQPAANTGLHINNFPSTSVSFNKQKLVGSTNNTDRNLAASPNRPGLATQTIINQINNVNQTQYSIRNLTANTNNTNTNTSTKPSVKFNSGPSNYNQPYKYVDIFRNYSQANNNNTNLNTKSNFISSQSSNNLGHNIMPISTVLPTHGSKNGLINTQLFSSSSNTLGYASPFSSPPLTPVPSFSIGFSKKDIEYLNVNPSHQQYFSKFAHPTLLPNTTVLTNINTDGYGNGTPAFGTPSSLVQNNSLFSFNNSSSGNANFNFNNANTINDDSSLFTSAEFFNKIKSANTMQTQSYSNSAPSYAPISVNTAKSLHDNAYQLLSKQRNTHLQAGTQADVTNTKTETKAETNTQHQNLFKQIQVQNDGAKKQGNRIDNRNNINIEDYSKDEERRIKQEIERISAEMEKYKNKQIGNIVNNQRIHKVQSLVQEEIIQKQAPKYNGIADYPKYTQDRQPKSNTGNSNSYNNNSKNTNGINDEDKDNLHDVFNKYANEYESLQDQIKGIKQKNTGQLDLANRKFDYSAYDYSYHQQTGKQQQDIHYNSNQNVNTSVDLLKHNNAKDGANQNKTDSKQTKNVDTSKTIYKEYEYLKIEPDYQLATAEPTKSSSSNTANNINNTFSFNSDEIGSYDQEHNKHTIYTNNQIHAINPVSVIPELSQQSGGEDEDKQYAVEQYENGSRYEGEKLNGMRDGKGKFYYKEGSYYNGNWKKNNMHGFGKLFYPNHNLAYEGDWFIDQFHGYGKVYNDEPTPIEGGFDYTNFDMLDEKWRYYEGTLVCDSKEGFGKLALSNGEYYEGNFQGDRVHGQGKFVTFTGNTIRGIWQQSRLIKVLN